MISRISTLLVLSLSLSETMAQAALITPAGFNPGDQFRIVFVSSTVRNGTSSIFSDYDLFVTTRAIAAGIDTYSDNAVTWHAIVSTPPVGITPAMSAISRLPVSSPAIYGSTALWWLLPARICGTARS